MGGLPLKKKKKDITALYKPEHTLCEDHYPKLAGPLWQRLVRVTRFLG